MCVKTVANCPLLPLLPLLPFLPFMQIEPSGNVVPTADLEEFIINTTKHGFGRIQGSLGGGGFLNGSLSEIKGILYLLFCFALLKGVVTQHANDRCISTNENI